MTDQMETYLRETFVADALKAPPAAGLAQAARNLARTRQRRRLATSAGSVLTIAVIVSMFSLFRGDAQEAVVPVQPVTAVPAPSFTGPLTREECPVNSAVMTGGFYGSDKPFEPARKQAEDLGERLVLGRHPEATLVQESETSDRSAFAYVLPNGYRVAYIEFTLQGKGWYMEGANYC